MGVLCSSIDRATSVAYEVTDNLPRYRLRQNKDEVKSVISEAKVSLRSIKPMIEHATTVGLEVPSGVGLAPPYCLLSSSAWGRHEVTKGLKCCAYPARSKSIKAFY